MERKWWIRGGGGKKGCKSARIGEWEGWIKRDERKRGGKSERKERGKERVDKREERKRGRK